MRRWVLLQTTMVATALMAVSLLTANPAHAATTFTVNSIGDANDLDFPGGTFDGSSDGKCFTGDILVIGEECTLRAAIQQANRSSGADTINFDIPTTAVATISPGSQLPTITQRVTIDGYTQSGAIKNTIPLAEDGTNAVLKIEIDGDLWNLANGLVFEGSDASKSIIRGLAINDFYSACIILADGTGFKVEGNFLGTDPSGTNGSLASGFPGSEVGVDLIRTSNSTIGGLLPDQRNLISGNGYAGVDIGGSSGNRVEGNLMGTKANGTEALPTTPNGTDTNSQQRNGVVIGTQSKSNTIGGVDANRFDTSNPANTIAFNSEDGVLVFGSSGNRILSNSIFSNGQLGIDLGDDGVTANDGRDADKGANHLQNYPQLLTATATNVTGTLKSTPNTTFIIQFYSNPEKPPNTNSGKNDPSGFGEGKTFLGQRQMKTNRKGKLSFDFFGPLLPGENVFTATATNKSTGDTSEFSNDLSPS
jgi:parallel beta-helix repeat protein